MILILGVYLLGIVLCAFILGWLNLPDYEFAGAFIWFVMIPVWLTKGIFRLGSKISCARQRKSWK